jgi:acyl-CoA thioesterase I
MRTRCRYAPQAVVALASMILATGCASGAAPAGSTQSRPRSFVALGDSVPAGSNCRCVPYPELSASSLTTPAISRNATVANDAVGGYTSADVLTQLSSDPDVVSDVAEADVVEIEVGANDVAYSDSCGTSVACYQPLIPPVERNLARIIARIREVTQGRPVLVVLLDYWNVWLGGRYAQAQGQTYSDAAATVTDQLSSVVKQTAADTGSSYVDLRAAFKGPDYTDDETPYLASDGDHPNAAGHRLIAAAVADMITQTLHQ